MDRRLFIALFLGLLIQLSYVQVCGGGPTAEPCGTAALPMGCCEGLKSCPCAEESRSDQTPAPLTVVAVDLKWHLLKAAETPACAALISPPEDSESSAAPITRVCGGFAGVPLSVAFCSFVI
jgi:hypothetical protein